MEEPKSVQLLAACCFDLVLSVASLVELGIRTRNSWSIRLAKVRPESAVTWKKAEGAVANDSTNTRQRVSKHAIAYCSLAVATLLTETLPSGTLCRPHDKNITTVHVWPQTLCIPEEDMHETYTQIEVVMIVLAWSSAVAACSLHHTKDRAQGVIVLFVLTGSLCIGTTVFKLDPAQVAIWSITFGLLLSAVAHRVRMSLKKEWGNESWREVKVRDLEGARTMVQPEVEPRFASH